MKKWWSISDGWNGFDDIKDKEDYLCDKRWILLEGKTFETVPERFHWVQVLQWSVGKRGCARKSKKKHWRKRMASKSTAFLRWRSFVSLDLNSSFYYHVIALVTVGVINITCIVNGFRPGRLPKSDAVKYGIKDSSPVRVKVALCWDVKKGYFIFCCWESTSICSRSIFHRTIF